MKRRDDGTKGRCGVTKPPNFEGVPGFDVRIVTGNWTRIDPGDPE
jgi:hypothetical protein